ncbi:MAG: 4Fe-4S dicluster domain-containing protein [Hyphomicrobiaceae bacterium]|nr:4Fe-4S dicluster domain-containing protein [Hyphomicrobiaceae bacterium]
MKARSQSSPLVIGSSGLDRLITLLAEQGYSVIGPRLRDDAIVYEGITSSADLPRGILDEQKGGHYRTYREGEAYFGYVVGPSSWKRFLHPPRQVLWRGDKRDGSTTIQTQPVADERYAFIGVRACELAAILVQDRVFLHGPYRDPHYAARRESSFIVAVNCGRAAETCFCDSMGTGPKAQSGYDIALTEIATGSVPAFLVDVGSDKGQELVDNLPSRPATDDDISAAEQATAHAISQIQRRIDTDGISELLKSEYNHPRWNDVAARCLSCANCTMVCPTCFCTTVEETSDLQGAETARVQRWESCFTVDFSYVHGGSVRASPASRYRQWMTHKLATWHDQFGTSGCVGCGRCITWCPVGIDITEEAAAIRGS